VLTFENCTFGTGVCSGAPGLPVFIPTEYQKTVNQVHEPDFEILSLFPAEGSNLYLDIGANRGEAIQSILMKRPEARIVAFEPNSYLSKN